MVLIAVIVAAADMVSDAIGVNVSGTEKDGDTVTVFVWSGVTVEDAVPVPPSCCVADDINVDEGVTELV